MKHIILILAIAFSSTSIFSQSNNSFFRYIDDSNGYGFRFGTNISSLDFSNDMPPIENTHRNSLMAAIFVEFALSNRLILSPEIQYSAEGSKDERLRLDFLNFPVLFKFYLFEGLSINLGPQVNLKIHEFEDNYKNFSFSGVGGIEYLITDRIFIDARYSYGFTNVFDDETLLDAQNRNIQLGVGIKL